MRMTKEEREQWERLYRKADFLPRLVPLGCVNTMNIAGILPAKKKEPFFIQFCELQEGSLGLRILPGWDALGEFITRLQNPTQPVSTWQMEIPSLEIFFLPPTMVFSHERVFLRKIKRLYTKHITLQPIFRSIHPGYHSWLPTKQERDLLEVLLDQTLGILLRMEQEQDLLVRDLPERMLIVRQQKNGAWEDFRSPLKHYEDKGVEVTLKASFVTEFQKLSRVEMNLEMDVQLLPIGLKNPVRREAARYMLLGVNRKTCMIMAGRPLDASKGLVKMWAEIPEQLLSICRSIGGYPSVIEVSSERLIHFLQALEIYQPFKLVQREKLKTIDEAMVRVTDRILDLIKEQGKKRSFRKTPKKNTPK